MLTNYSNLNDKEKQEYEASIKQLYVILGVASIIYYLFPYLMFIVYGTTGGAVIVSYFIPTGFTVMNYMCSFLHYRKHGFKLYVPLGVALFFIPSVMVFGYDLKVAGFAIVFFVIGLFGDFTGYLFARRRKNRRQPIGLNSLTKDRSNKGSKKKKKKTK